MKMKSGLFGLLFRLRRDDRGSILIQATLIIVVIMGMIGLALDGGRFFMAHNDLQDLADAAALAGAKKLDASTGAMAAATSCGGDYCWRCQQCAVVGCICSQSSESVQFYKSLADLDANNQAGLDKDAVYIKVTTGAWQIAPTFLAAVGASNNSAQATAVAESGTSLCVPASMMLCNPSDDGTTPDTSSFDAPGPKQVLPGKMFVFSTNGNTTFSPGVFSLLDDSDGTNCGSDPCVKKLLSRQNPRLCTAGGTSPAQGQKNDATIDGINVRFEQQPNGMPGNG